MYDLSVPCGVFIFLFLMSFVCCCWFYKHRYINPLEHRIRWLEQQFVEPQKKGKSVRRQPTTTKSHFVSVEREVHPDYIRT